MLSHKDTRKSMRLTHKKGIYEGRKLYVQEKVSKKTCFSVQSTWKCENSVSVDSKLNLEAHISVCRGLVFLSFSWNQRFSTGMEMLGKSNKVENIIIGDTISTHDVLNRCA